MGVITCGSVSRTFVATLVCLVIALGVLGWSLWDSTRVKAPRFRPSRLLADTVQEVLCRPPFDVEVVNWDNRPFDRSTLVSALESTEEFRRLQQARQSYVDALRREATREECTEFRHWIDRHADLDTITREIASLPEARRVAAVRQLFIDMFGRDPRGWDDPGLRRWVDSPLGLGEIRSRLREQRPLVGVHYFAWYEPDPGGWRNEATRVPADSPKPARGWYDSSNSDVMAAQIRQMEETGFDFVAVHVIPLSPRSWSNAHTFFDRLSGHRLKAALVLDGLYDQTAAMKAMWVERAKEEFTGDSHYLRLHGEPLVMMFSTRLDFDVPRVILRNVYWSYRYDPGENAFNGTLRLEPRDWPFWAPTPQPLANGMVPVIPGYDDAALGRSRSMVHERGNGQMYRDQWRRALALHPEVILVYSWNEYFERTPIEPTDAWGDQYLRMTACFIGHAHRGTMGTC
jgi:hypothetical protein